jgi:hypothetical protein
MNERLAEFLMSLVRDPEKLEAFNDDTDARRSLVQEADLSDEEREALLSNDSIAILRLLQAGDDDGLTWVGIPRIKLAGDDAPRIKFTVGFAIFGIKDGATLASAATGGAATSRGKATGSKKSARGAAKSRKRAGAKAAKSSKAAKKSTAAKKSRAAKSRGAAKRRR